MAAIADQCSDVGAASIRVLTCSIILKPRILLAQVCVVMTVDQLWLAICTGHISGAYLGRRRKAYRSQTITALSHKLRLVELALTTMKRSTYLSKVCFPWYAPLPLSQVCSVRTQVIKLEVGLRVGQITL